MLYFNTSKFIIKKTLIYYVKKKNLIIKVDKKINIIYIIIVYFVILNYKL